MAGSVGVKVAAFGAVGLVGLVVTGAVVAPMLVDVNAYKPQAVAAASEALGRPVSVDGDLTFSVLPWPSVSASGLRIANLPGGSEPDMVRVENITVNLSLGSLFTGTVRADNLVLSQPRVLLEKTASGANWVFAKADAGPVVTETGLEAVPSQPQAPSASQGQAPSQPAADINQVFDLALDDVEIQGGTVIYRDHGQDYRLDGIGLQGRAQALTGPFHGSGQMVYVPPGRLAGPGAGVPFSLEASVGSIRDGLSAPVSLRLAVEGKGDAPLLQASFSGLLAGSSNGRTLRGDLNLQAPKGAEFAAAIGSKVPLPPGEVSIKAGLTAGPQRFALEALRADLGESHAEGQLSWDGSGDLGRIDGALTIGRIDLDQWLVAQQAAQQSPRGDTQGDANAGPDRSANEVAASGGAAGSNPPVDSGSTDATAGGGSDHVGIVSYTIPTNLRGVVDVKFGAITLNGRAMRQGHMAVGFDGQGVFLQEATILMPGSASVIAAGRVSPAPPEQGGVAFDLALQAQADNLRDFLGWQGVTLNGIHPARLTRGRISASFGGTLAQLTIPDLEAVVDTTALRGAATIRFPQQAGQKIGIGLTVQAAKLNLDAYRMPAGTSAAMPNAAAAPAEQTPNTDQTSPEPRTLDRPPQGPARAAGAPWWTAFDANVHLAAQTVIWNDVPFQGAVVKGSLINGALTLKDVHVDDLAGGALSATGTIIPKGTDWAAAILDGVTVSLSSPDPRRTARAMGVDSSFSWPEGQPLALYVTASGAMNAQDEPLSISLAAEAAGGKATLNGQLSKILMAPTLEGSLKIDAPDAMRVIRLADPGYQPSAALGPLAVQTNISADVTGVSLSGLDLRVGQDRIAGDLTYRLGLTGVSLRGALRAESLNVDRFLPARRTAGLFGTRLAMAGDGGADTGQSWVQLASNAIHPRWSTAPLDLSGLQVLDGKIDLTAKALTAGNIMLTDLSTTIALEDGALNVAPLTSGLYGGTLSGAGSVVATAGKTPQLILELKIKGAQAGRLLRALEGASNQVNGVAGLASVTLSAQATGASEADLVQSFTGQGDFDFSGLNINKAADEIVVLKPLLALNQFAAMGSGEAGSQARIFGTLVSNNGIVQLRSVEVASALYQGRLQGVVNLPQWTLDVDGQVRMSQNLAAAFLRQHLKLPEVVPVSLSGDLDRPTVRVLGSTPTGSTGDAPPPKVETVVPALLDKYLGQGEEAPAESPEQPEVKPEKAARDLLRGLLFQ